MTIHDRIRQARLAAGLSINALSKRVGVSSTAAWHWDRADTTPRPETLARIAIALDTTIEALQGEKVIDDAKSKGARRETLDEILTDARTRIAALLGVGVGRVRLDTGLNPES